MSEQESISQTAKSGRFLKFGLAISLFFVVIFIGIVSMNLDFLRGPIVDELSQMTGLSIEIESLNLSLSNGLSLRGGGLKVSSKDDSQKIFLAEDFFLDAELKPLLKRQLKIKKIILVKPTMNVVLESKLGSNTLSDTPKIGEIVDQKTILQPSETASSDLPRKLQSEPSLIGSIQKILQRQDLSLRKFEIKDARLTLVRPQSNSLPARKIPVFVNARLDLSNPNTGQIDIDGELSHIKIGGINLTGTLKAIDLLGKHIPVNLALESTSLPITKINTLIETLASPELIPVNFESGEIEKMFIHLKGLINPNHNQLKEIVMKSGFKISDLEISIPESEKLAKITFSHLDGEGMWQKGILNYKINGNLWDGNIESNLVFNLPEAQKGSFTGTFNSETKLKELNLASAKFKLSDKWTPITGTVNGSIKTQGSINEPSSNTNKHGKLLINNLTLGSETPITFSQATLNLQQKSQQQTLARVQIKDALFNNFLIKKVDANLKIFPKRISLTYGRMVPLNGVILFSGDYYFQPNTYIIRINGKKIRTEDFLTEQIEGLGLFNGMFQGNLNTAQKIQQKGETVLFSHVASSLSGRLSIQLKDGKIRVSPVMDELFTLLKPASAAVTAQKQRLNFNVLGGDLKIWEGKVVTDNFELKGPQMNLAAMITANLATGKLDGEIKVMPIQLLENIANAIPLLGNLLTGDVVDIMAETYFRLGGTLEEPKLILEEGKTLFDEPADVLKELVKTSK